MTRSRAYYDPLRDRSERKIAKRQQKERRRGRLTNLRRSSGGNVEEEPNEDDGPISVAQDPKNALKLGPVLLLGLTESPTQNVSLYATTHVPTR